MITYTVQKQSGSIWEDIDGTWVYPLTCSYKLDESLDEAQAVCYGSTKKEIRPNTNVKITVGGESRYYKVSNDDAVEYPNGSGTYKHTLSLVEATKYLEGVMGQTLSFTNTLGRANEQYPAQFTFSGDYAGKMAGFTYDELVTPIRNSAFTISLEGICNAVAAWLGNEVPVYAPFYPVLPSSSCSWLTDTESGTISGYNEQQVTVDADMILTYSIMVVDRTSTHSTITATTAIAYMPTNISTKKWTIKTVCERLFDLAEPLYGTDTPRFMLDEDEEEYLGTILAPEFSISQSNLREQLRMVGGMIHAEPRVKLISYRSGKIIYRIGFDYYGYNWKTSPPSPYLIKRRTFSLANYQTRIYTNARNIVSSTDSSEQTITDPGKNAFKGVRAEQANIRISDNNAVVKTLEPIYDLKKVLCNIYQYDTGTYALEAPVDITPFCYEATEYDSILSSYRTSYPLTKAYGIRWKRGDRNITQLFYQAPNPISSAFEPWAITNILQLLAGRTDIDAILSNNKNQLCFQVQYKPVTNTAFIHEKSIYSREEPYTIPYSQSDSLVELSSYGENIRGAAERLGNAELEATAKFEDVDDIPTIGCRTMFDGEEWYVSAINAEYGARYITATLSLTKNFNRLSQFVGINSRKRISEVSEDQPYDREIVLPIKLVLGIGNNNTLPIYADYRPFFDLFTAFPTKHPITQAVLKIPYTDQKPVCLPAIAAGYGTATVLTTSLKDNYSAGESERYYTSTNNEVTGWWQYDLRFGDHYGRAEKMLVNFYDTWDSTEEYAYKYPMTSGTASTESPPGTVIGTISPYILHKDSRERLGTVSIVIECQSALDGVTVCPGVAKLNSFVCEPRASLPHLYLIPEEEEMPFKFDSSIVSYDRTSWTDCGEVFGQYSEGANYFNIAISTSLHPAGQGWVIAYPVEEETITVSGEDGTIEEQTVYKGGEMLILNSNPVAENETLITANYKFGYIM